MPAFLPNWRSLPQHTLYRLHPVVERKHKDFPLLCLSTLYTGCIVVNLRRFFYGWALPQHTLYRLHRQKYTVQLLTNCKMCCESVDSFSADHKRFTALTIFPCSFATKATYVAISGSIGRTIDRFCRCELCYNILIAMGSRNTHTWNRFWSIY